MTVYTGQRYFDVLRKHLELGTSLQHIRMTELQKERTRICMDAYNLLKQNPYMDIATFLKNKYNRSTWEIMKDKEVIDFITSVLDAGGKSISRYRVKRSYEIAMKMAHDKGNEKELISAAKHLADLEKLNEPEQGEDLENSIAKLPPILTNDARKILPGKTYSDTKQMDRIRAKWGVKKDDYQEAIDRRAEELSASGEDAPPSTGKEGFDLSSLSVEQLAALQRELNARMAVQAPQEIDDEDENEF